MTNLLRFAHLIDVIFALATAATATMQKIANLRSLDEDYYRNKNYDGGGGGGVSNAMYSRLIVFSTNEKFVYSWLLLNVVNGFFN